MPAYRFLAADLVTGTIRDEIPFTAVTYGRAKNSPGPFSASIRVDHAKATRANLDPARTIIYVERDGRIVADGIIWAARVQDRTLELAGQSLWSYFRRRLVRHTQTFTGIDQLAIFRSLIDYAQTQPGGDLDVIVDTTVSGVLRDRTYPGYERKNLGDACEELAAVDGGFDFEGECGWESGAIVRRIRLGYPRRGRRTEFVFQLGVNLEDYSTQVEGDRQAWLVDAIGQGEGDAMLISTAVDTSLSGTYPLLEAAVAWKDVSQRTTLQGHADARLRQVRLPVEIPALRVMPSGEPRFSSYIPGDEVQIRIDDGWTQTTGWFALQGYQVTVDHDGREAVSMSFAGADAA